MTAQRSWNQGVSWVAFTLTKHIQYSRLTHVSCVGVMDQYLLIRATLCVASLKIWWAWVIIAVFSVNHASGARSPPGQTSPLRGRQETFRLRHRSGHHQPRFCKTLMDGLLWRYNKLSRVWILNQFLSTKSLLWVLPTYITSLGTPTSTYLKFNPCRHPWIVLRLSLK